MYLLSYFKTLGESPSGYPFRNFKFGKFEIRSTKFETNSNIKFSNVRNFKRNFSFVTGKSSEDARFAF